MNKLQIVTLGEKEYPLGDFTIGQVQKLVPMFQAADDEIIASMKTLDQSQATTNIVYIGLQTGGYTGKYADFLELRGVTKQQLFVAQRVIGAVIGTYKPLDDIGGDPEPGEAKGEESP